MKIPVDCKLLQIGLKYTLARSKRVAEELRPLVTQSCFDQLQSATKCKDYLHQNIIELNPKIGDKHIHKVELKFEGDTNIHLETLQIEGANDQLLISNVDFEEGQAIEGPAAKDENLTPLDLLRVAITFSVADATTDFDVHPKYAADDIEAFGLKGKEKVLKFLQEELGPWSKTGKPAYRLDFPFRVDFANRKVTLGFECLIDGYSGRGTDHVYFNDQGLIRKIDAIRH